MAGAARGAARRASLQRRAIPDALWQRRWRAALPRARGRRTSLQRLRRLASLFLDRKEFSGAGGFDVTDAMAVRIAVQACLPVLELGLSSTTTASSAS